MRVCLFDSTSSADGHHPPFVAGIANELLATGHQVRVAALKPALTSPPCDWLPLSRCPTGRLRTVPRGRAVVNDVVAWTRATGGPLWDLHLNDKLLWTTRDLVALPARVHVLHLVNLLDPRSWRPNHVARAAVARACLRRLATNGGRIFVHTAADAARVRAVCDVPTHVVGLAICSRAEVDQRQSQPSGRRGADVRLLFGGTVSRPEKGFRALLDALSLLPQPPHLHVVGPQRRGAEQAIARDYPRARLSWTVGQLSTSELSEQIRACDLFVLPYQPLFEHRGGTSGMLYEALSNGKPTIVTPFVEPLLPQGFPGGVVARGSSPSDLALAIKQAIDRLDELSAAAREAGPAVVRAYHTFEAYVGALRS